MLMAARRIKTEMKTLLNLRIHSSTLITAVTVYLKVFPQKLVTPFLGTNKKDKSTVHPSSQLVIHVGKYEI